VILLLLLMDVALIRQNQNLKAELSRPSAAMQLQAGTVVPPLEGYGASGEKLLFDYGHDPRKTVLFVFSPTCSFCEENWPRWRQITAALNTESVRPLAVDVSSGATRGFADGHGLANMPLLIKIEPGSLVSYRFRLTPQTILIDPQGKVEKIWSGVLTADQLKEISALMRGNSDPS
jgi:peroxiredoxin